VDWSEDEIEENDEDGEVDDEEGTASSQSADPFDFPSAASKGISSTPGRAHAALIPMQRRNT
jgi:hypothetical protein